MRVTHDLRTPLTAIRGHAAALADGVVPPDDVPRSLAAIEGEAARLETLVADLLDLARLDAHRFKLDLAAWSPAEVLDRAFDAMEAEAVARGRRLRAPHRPDLPSVRHRRGPRAADRGQPARQRHPLDAAAAARCASRGGRCAGGGFAAAVERHRPRHPRRRAGADLRRLPVERGARRAARQRPRPGHQPAARPGARRRRPGGEPRGGGQPLRARAAREGRPRSGRRRRPPRV